MRLQSSGEVFFFIIKGNVEILISGSVPRFVDILRLCILPRAWSVYL